MVGGVPKCYWRIPITNYILETHQLTSERLKFLSWATGQLLSIHIEHHHTPDALPDENNTEADIAALRTRASNASAYAQQACPLALAVQAISAPC